MTAKPIFIFILSILFPFLNWSQGESSPVQIEGFAPDYVGKEITISEIQDYFSDREAILSRSTVGPDSLFQFNFSVSETQKMVISSNNNKGWIYIEPSGKYQVSMPFSDRYLPSLKSGNTVELTFYNLPEDDINYKILSFQRWSDDYMSRAYRFRTSDPKKFAEKLDSFKLFAENAYKEEKDIFFLTHVRFSIAELDEIEFAGSRNRFEKFDFYIKPSPVFYNNDVYMNYVEKYFRNFVPRLSNEANQMYYKAVLKSSPTLLMRSLGTEYALSNLRLREMIMIKSLSEVFYTGDFPQTNIMTILDSLSHKCLFRENEILSKNLIFRLTDLVPGAPAPKFVLYGAEESIKTNYDYLDKHLYIQFYDPSIESNLFEFDLLKKLHSEYGEHVQFLSIAVSESKMDTTMLKFNADIPWETHLVNPNDAVLDKFRVRSFPYYVLIDGTGSIVGAPALSPRPNSKYETIDRSFYYIKRIREEAQR